MSPFRVVYGKGCRVPSNSNSPENKLILGSDMLEEMESTVKIVWYNLKAAQDKKKEAYADKKRTYREFQVGDNVYVRVKPKRSLLTWGSYKKLAPRYFGPFQIFEGIGPVTC